MTDVAEKRAGGRNIAFNAVWSLAGTVLPAAIGLAAVPRIVHRMGDERFGMLTLTWMVIGYFSLFDLGVGRAVTRQVSKLLESPDRGELGEVLWTAWYLMTALGVVGMLVALASMPYLLRGAVKVSPEFYREASASFHFVAFTIPVVVLTAGVQGALEGAQKFKLVNAVRMPSGVLSFALPLAIVFVTPTLPPIIAALIGVRVMGLVAYLALCFRALPDLGFFRPFSRRRARELLRFGSWLTVSNVVSPLMESFDRFIVAGMLSAAAVTYYATPSDAMSKILMVPSAIAAVLFPAFAAASSSDRAKLTELFRAGMRAIFLALVPATFLVVCFAPELLGLWLGPQFAQRSSGVLRWLIVGLLVNGLAFLPYNLLQGLDRADLTAKMHVIELPFYLAVLIPLLKLHGIDGAAEAWCLRVTGDAVALFWLAKREARIPLRDLLPSRFTPLVLVALVIVGRFAPSLPLKGVATFAFAIAFLAVAWWWGLEPDHRAYALARLRGRPEPE